MIYSRLPLDMYSRCVTFIYGTTDQVNRRMKRDLPNGWEPIGVQCNGHWCVRETDGYQADYIIVVEKPHPGTHQQARDHRASILMHEVLHCASHNLRHAGLQHTAETEEAYTYYAEYLFRRCLKDLP